MTYAVGDKAVYTGWLDTYRDASVTITNVGMDSAGYMVETADGNALYVFEGELTPPPATRTLDEVYALLVEIKEALNRD